MVTLPSVTLGKEPLPSAFCPGTRQSCQKIHYQVSLSSASTLALGKAVYTTMCFTALPSARALALGKEFSKKNIFSLPSAVSARHSAKDFSKKYFFSLPSAGSGRHLAKDFSKKNIFSLPSAGSGRLSAKDFSKKKGKALPSAFLTRHSAKTPSTADGQFSLPSAVLALGKAFAECLTNGTRQRTLRRMRLCRLLFAECGTRQSICRVQ